MRSTPVALELCGLFVLPLDELSYGAADDPGSRPVQCLSNLADLVVLIGIKPDRRQLPQRFLR
jgi:hypothetical protein